MKLAEFSHDRVYRYFLTRSWSLSSDLRWAMFVGLNPSTADETLDDPTVRRCIDYAKRWNCDGLIMTNLFAYRSTDPHRLYEIDDPVGPDNDRWLCEMRSRASIVVGAWGNHGTLRDRDRRVRELLGPMKCLGENSNGTPKHPLYLKKTQEPVDLR